MDNPGITPRALNGAGELTTFYAYQSGPARSLVLANMAWLLAGREHATAPVLMIDWDVESPGLHYLFGAEGNRPGLLELLEACRARHAELMQAAADAGCPAAPDDIARAVFAAVDWQGYVERVDAGRPLYLLRAGRFDHDYGERAAQFDWHALYLDSPALLRQFRIQLAQAFRHVFIDARCGRSAAVSVCTALLPDKIVGLFTPHPASLDGLCGAVRRAIAYRCSHEEEQRPLLLYPAPCAPAGVERAQRLRWRHGADGYQARLEVLMGASYGLRQVSLARYCDDVLLHTDTLSPQAGAAIAACGVDQLAPARTFAALLDWFADSRLPWQGRELRARGAGSSRIDDHPPALALAPLTMPDAPVQDDGPAQFPALRHLGALLGGSGLSRAGPAGSGWALRGNHGTGSPTRGHTRDDAAAAAAVRRESPLDAAHMRQLADAVETQLDQLQQLVDRQALREARPLADTLRQLVLRPALALALRRRGAALIKLVYRHDNDTDALLAFTQDELTALERVLNDAAAGRPLAYS